MASSILLPVAILLSLVVAISSRQLAPPTSIQASHVEEREVMKKEDFEKYLATQDKYAKTFIDFTKMGISAIGKLGHQDLSKMSGGQIAWEVASQVVPIIGAALALIPGIGVIVSGLFLQLWALVSPIFAPKKDNPMEKMIKKLAEDLTNRMDSKLQSVINRAIYGEITRNNYICSKYNYVSEDYKTDLDANKQLSTTDALKMMVYLDNCDNFLKDTAEAFVYHEYADVLWIPGAITTIARLGFLRELLKYGPSLGMQKNVTAMYMNEIIVDTERQFTFFSEGMEIGRDQQYKNKDPNYSASKDYLQGVSDIERASCSIQGQFLYFDPTIYPYGKPTVLNNTDMLGTVSLPDLYNPSKDGDVKHIQVFFNVSKATYTKDLPQGKQYRVLEFMNCFLGPMRLNSPNTVWFRFEALAANKYSYEFRVIYMSRFRSDKYEEAVPVLTSYMGIPDNSVYTSLYGSEWPYRGQTSLKIEFLSLTDVSTKDRAEQSQKLKTLPGWARWKTCPFQYDDKANSEDMIACNNRKFFEGLFRFYSAGVFNHRDEIVNPIITIEEPTQAYPDNPHVTKEPSGFIVGTEIIVRPLI